MSAMVACRRLVPLLAAAALLVQGTAQAAGPPEKPKVVPGEVIVQFEPGAESQQRSRARSAAGARSARALSLPRTQRLELGDRADVHAAAQRLERQPGVAWAAPNFVVDLYATPSDPRYGEQWAPQRVGAPAAWDITTGSPATTVAVIDSGIDLDHPDLAAAIWQNPGESGAKATNGVDDDANGFVDDTRGWDWFSGDNVPSDVDGHGTHVAGIIGARANNGAGIAGTDWQAKLLPLRVCGGSCEAEDVMEAMVYAGEAEADVANLSLGVISMFQGYIAAAEAYPETLFVAAAGNNALDLDLPGLRVSPCEYATMAANIVCVAASSSADGTDTLAPFSNYGAAVDLAAPGESILSTLPDEGSRNGTGYGVLSGTSMAAPAVSGAAALLHAVDPGAEPAELRRALAHGAIRDALVGAAPVAGQSLGPTPLSSGAELNLPLALAAVTASDAPVATAPPRIRGEVVVGHELRAWRGRWTGVLGDLTFRWEREGAGGFAPIPGASGRTYTLGSDDAGRRVRVVVSAGPTGSASAPTATVAPQRAGALPLGPAAFARIDGAMEHGAATRVRAVGDVNGDGHVDVAVDRCGLEDLFFSCSQPQVHVLFGPISESVDLGAVEAGRGFVIQGNLAASIFANPAVFDAAGDFDGDGFDDLVVGENLAGRAWVVFGSATPTDVYLADPGDRALTVSGDYFLSLGVEVTGLGDVDGDGRDDVGLTADPWDPYTGSGFTNWQGAMVLYGRTSRDAIEVQESVPASTLSRVKAAHPLLIGYSEIAAAGDVDGDGYDDVVYATRRREDGTPGPTIFVVRGGPARAHVDLASPPTGRTFSITDTDVGFIAPQIVGGDVDGDGFSDLVIGGVTVDEIGALGREQTKGRVVYGRSVPRDVDLSPFAPQDGYEWHASRREMAKDVAVGDLDGDGRAEPVIGAAGLTALSRYEAGAVAVLRDGRRGFLYLPAMSATDGLLLAGDQTGDGTGTSVDVADLNGDGRAELLAVAREQTVSGRARAGRVHIVAFRPGELVPDPTGGKPVDEPDPDPDPADSEVKGDTPPAIGSAPPVTVPPSVGPGASSPGDAEPARRRRLLAAIRRVLGGPALGRPVLRLGSVSAYAPSSAGSGRLVVPRGRRAITVLAVTCTQACRPRVDAVLSLRRGGKRIGRVRFGTWSQRLGGTSVGGVVIRLSPSVIRRIRSADRADLALTLRSGDRRATRSLRVIAR